MIGFVFGHFAHTVVVDLVVADAYSAAKLVVDTVAQRGVKITLDIVHAVKVVLGKELDKHIVYAVFYQLAVGSELHAKSEKTVNILVI